jgi:hypothetical protein
MSSRIASQDRTSKQRLVWWKISSGMLFLLPKTPLSKPITPDGFWLNV